MKQKRRFTWKGERKRGKVIFRAVKFVQLFYTHRFVTAEIVERELQMSRAQAHAWLREACKAMTLDVEECDYLLDENGRCGNGVTPRIYKLIK